MNTIGLASLNNLGGLWVIVWSLVAWHPALGRLKQRHIASWAVWGQTEEVRLWIGQLTYLGQTLCCPKNWLALGEADSQEGLVRHQTIKIYRNILNICKYI